MFGEVVQSFLCGLKTTLEMERTQEKLLVEMLVGSSRLFSSLTATRVGSAPIPGSHRLSSGMLLERKPQFRDQTITCNHHYCSKTRPLPPKHHYSLKTRASPATIKDQTFTQASPALI